jgi:peptidoglycan/LPS O-acetylase OafA/YrhL
MGVAREREMVSISGSVFLTRDRMVCNGRCGPWTYLAILHVWSDSCSFRGCAIAALFIHRESWQARLLSWAPLVYVGKVSYGIYLFHPFVSGAVERGLRLKGNGSAPGQLVVFFSTLAGSPLVAGLHFQYVETRFLKLRNRKAKRDAERLVLTSPPASAL